MTKIVVGVDGSAEADLALRWAYDEARLRGAELHVVHAWIYPYVGPPGSGTSEPYNEMRSEAEATLEHVVDRALRELPGGVFVQSHLVEGSPAGELLREAKDALMLVVGSRGRGGFASLLLGSTSQQVAHHAECPVVIVRADT